MGSEMCIRDSYGFEWTVNGETKYYFFVVLPFGLGPAARILTRLIKEVIRYIRKHGIRSSIFIDDNGTVAENYEKAKRYAKFVRKVFTKAGFIISESKSMKPEDATQEVTYLGFIINSISMTISASKEKLTLAKEWLEKGIRQKQMTVRDWAILRGIFVSLVPARK